MIRVSSKTFVYRSRPGVSLCFTLIIYKYMVANLCCVLRTVGTLDRLEMDINSHFQQQDNMCCIHYSLFTVHYSLITTISMTFPFLLFPLPYPAVTLF